jgi:hypothetical protein
MRISLGIKKLFHNFPETQTFTVLVYDPDPCYKNLLHQFHFQYFVLHAILSSVNSFRYIFGWQQGEYRKMHFLCTVEHSRIETVLRLRIS